MTSYLDRYDAAAAADKFPLVRRWMDTEPLPFFEELRARRPVLVTPMCTLLARFDDVAEVLSQPKHFTVALYRPKMANGLYLMAHDDDALHGREKAIMQGLLNRDDLPRVRALVARLANELLDRAPGRKLEVAYGYSRSVPAGLVQEYFGLTGAARKELIEWSYWNQYDTFHNQPFDVLSDEQRRHVTERHDAASAALERYVTRLIARRLVTVRLSGLWHWLRVRYHKLRGHRDVATDDIVARMLRSRYPAEVDFDIKRLGVNVAGLLIGAIETTAQCVTQIVQYLLESPEWSVKARAAARLPDPAPFDGIVWEALRFVPLAPYLFREAGAEYTVGRGTDHATTIPPGTYVLPLTQSAMFDARAFETPERFIPRRNWYHYFHFGFGAHECLGKHIGMVMIPEMVRQLFLRDGLEAIGRIDNRGGPFPERYELRWGG